jgi:hypothetical protein
MKKKVIYGVVITLLLSVVLFMYNEFNGNPLSQYLAKRELETYIAQEYPDHTLRLESRGYNFKFSDYMFDAFDIGSAENQVYRFAVRGLIFPEVRYDELRATKLDHELMERISEQAADELFQLLTQSADNIRQVNVTVEILKGRFHDTLQWDKALEFDQPLDLFIVLDSANASKQDTLESARLIQRLLNEAGYTYDRVNINGNIFDHQEIKREEYGYVKYAVAFGPETDLTVKDIQEY